MIDKTRFYKEKRRKERMKKWGKRIKKLGFGLLLFVIFYLTNCTGHIESIFEYVGLDVRGDGFMVTPAFLMILIMVIAWKK